MRDRRGRSPRPVRVSRALRDFRQEIQPESPLAGVQAVWEEVVGEQIALVTSLAEEVEGTLFVDCQSAVWSEELSLMEPQIRANLAKAMEGDPPAKLRFRSVS